MDFFAYIAILTGAAGRGCAAICGLTNFQVQVMERSLIATRLCNIRPLAIIEHQISASSSPSSSRCDRLSQDLHLPEKHLAWKCLPC